MAVFSHFSGKWWLPENPDVKIYGTLTHDRTGSILRLVGGFDAESEIGDSYKIILGLASDDKRITLRRCVLTSFIRRMPEKRIMESELFVNILCIGYHFPREEDIKFRSLSIKFSQLEEWIGKRWFRFSSEEGEEDSLMKNILTSTMPKSRELVALHGFRISIGYSLAEKGNGWRTSGFEASAMICVDVEDESKMDAMLSIAYHMRNFLSLAIGSRVSILSIEGQTKDHEHVQVPHYEEPLGDRVPFPFMLFHFTDISKEPEFYLRNWFNLIEKIEPTYDLFFGTISNPYLYPTHEFLSLMQAIESFQSRATDNHTLPKALFDELLSQILNVICKIERENRQHFVDKARTMNRKSLRTKMKELFGRYGGILGFIDDERKFIGKVVDSRNYYTHYDENLEKRAARIRDLPLLSHKVRLILIAVLLKEIDFNDEFIKQALQRYISYQAPKRIA